MARGSAGNLDATSRNTWYDKQMKRSERVLLTVSVLLLLFWQQSDGLCDYEMYDVWEPDPIRVERPSDDNASKNTISNRTSNPLFRFVDEGQIAQWEAFERGEYKPTRRPIALGWWWLCEYGDTPGLFLGSGALAWCLSGLCPVAARATARSAKQ